MGGQCNKHIPQGLLGVSGAGLNRLNTEELTEMGKERVQV